MAKDDRLYARFDIAMDEHPKVMLLSDAAFRALHEATYYSRRQLTDGFLDERVALRKWRQDVIDELSSNHPERPSWVRVEGGWQIRDYADHQTTTADIQAKKDAGRLGGLAKAKRNSSKPVAGATKVLVAESWQNATAPLAITETETEKETKKETKSRGSRAPDSFEVTQEMREWAKAETPLVDVDKKLAEWLDYWRSVPGQRGVKLDWVGVWRNGMRKQQEFAERDRGPVQPKKRQIR